MKSIRPVTTSTFSGRLAAATVVLPVLLGGASCSVDHRDASPHPTAGRDVGAARTRQFDVHWPLIEPASEGSPDSKSLLTGQLRVRPDVSSDLDVRLAISLTLIRPETEEHRRFWNSSLEYREHRWMDRLRVWDADQMWLYPNLPYLFQLHGVDRIERYGGWDPGHDVDNDFGAVLIRACGGADNQDDPATLGDPLVSAAWHGEGVENPGRRTIVHRARSDEFTIHLPSAASTSRGRIKVWFVYGDFMGHRVPDGWPQEPELDGGTLVFFHIDWHLVPGKPLEFRITQQTPEPTGFDWRGWVGRSEESARPVGEARLEWFSTYSSSSFFSGVVQR
jgi:hypothetical protein